MRYTNLRLVTYLLVKPPLHDSRCGLCPRYTLVYFLFALGHIDLIIVTLARAPVYVAYTCFMRQCVLTVSYYSFLADRAYATVLCPAVVCL